MFSASDFEPRLLCDLLTILLALFGPGLFRVLRPSFWFLSASMLLMPWSASVSICFLMVSVSLNNKTTMTAFGSWLTESSTSIADMFFSCLKMAIVVPVDKLVSSVLSTSDLEAVTSLVSAGSSDTSPAFGRFSSSQVLT
jgi:hypothetical protein